MELQQLILELKVGIRLPTPDCCPSTIANMIKTCFKEQPTERPSFLELKNSVALSYSGIRRASTAAIKTEIETQHGVDYADILMEEQYLKMKKENKIFEKNMKGRENVSSSVTFNPASLTASYKNNVGQYVSLQHAISSMSEIPSSRAESLDPLLNNSENPAVGANLGNRHSISPVSPISPDHKRHFSFSAGEDSAPFLQPRKRYYGLTPSKSYPNPLYITSLANLDGTKPPAI